MKPFRPSVLALACVLCASVNAFADVSLKPVPTPDLSKLPPANADAVRKERASFENVSRNVTGDVLAETYGLLAAAYAREGFYGEAAVALEDAVQIAPSSSRWVYAQGIVARAQRRNAEAQAFFKRAQTLAPSDLPIRVALANIEIEQGDLDAARTRLAEFSAKVAWEPVPHALLGDIALRQKRYAEAIDQYQAALKLDPKATRLNMQLAAAYEGSGDAKAAADARAKAGNGMPTLYDPVGLRFVGSAPAPEQQAGEAAGDPLARALAEASVYMTSRQYDKARQRLGELLRQHPDNPVLLGMDARNEAAAGNLARAKERAEAAVVAGPGNPLAQLSLGFVLEMNGDDAGAQRAYDKALAADAKMSEALLRRGNYLMREKRYDDASRQYRAMIANDPSDMAGWVHLVAAEVAAGRCGPVLKDVNGALAKDAKNGQLMQLFVRLASTCPTVGEAERKMALDYAKTMYAQVGVPVVAESYALALAANGRWDDAVQTEQAAMFGLLRSGKKDELGDYREFMQQFQAHKLPDRPWPADHVLFHPERAAPDPKQPAK